MKLIPFTEAYYSTLIHWIPDAKFNFLWGGPSYTWPVDAGQIRQCVKQDHVHACLLINDDRPMGYIDLVNVSENRIKLCRVLIARPEDRGRGHGKKLIELAVEKGKIEFNATHFELGVFEKNYQALRCYEAMGFQACDREKEFPVFNGETWPLIRMVLAPGQARPALEDNMERQS